MRAHGAPDLFEFDAACSRGSSPGGVLHLDVELRPVALRDELAAARVVTCSAIAPTNDSTASATIATAVVERPADDGL